MTNANPLISLRNSAIIWIGAALICLGGTWWFYHFLSDEGQITIAKIEKSTADIQLLRDEGVITKKDWSEMNNTARSEERWNTMKQLVPVLSKLVAPGTPAAAQNIVNMKLISQKTGTQPYITWLESTWTPEAQDALDKTQADIAEIIPLFAGISELASTEDIHGKITLKSLIEYIQTVIIDTFKLGNVSGEIGIEQVKFLEEAPEIGVYEVPLSFQNISNQNILKLLGFLRKTGSVVVTENGDALTITHQDPLVTNNTDKNISSLKNLLITVKSITITPTRNEKSTGIETLSTKNGYLWDANIVLQFYIRGVSRDHIVLLDNKIATWLNKTNAPDSLITQANSLIKSCGKCAQAPEIRDISSLLTSARGAYDSILLNEKTAKEDPTPIQVIERRTSLLTTLETLKQKLDSLNALLSTPIQ